MIEPETGALVLANGRIEDAMTLSSFAASPLAKESVRQDMAAEWINLFTLSPTPIGGLTFDIRLAFQGGRLESYSLSIRDPRYGSSWNDWTEEKQLALRKAHDAWLVGALGPGQRRESPKGMELWYAMPWAEVWSTFDARGGSSSIGVYFHVRWIANREDAMTRDPLRPDKT